MAISWLIVGIECGFLNAVSFPPKANSGAKRKHGHSEKSAAPRGKAFAAKRPDL